MRGEGGNDNGTRCRTYLATPNADSQLELTVRDNRRYSHFSRPYVPINKAKQRPGSFRPGATTLLSSSYRPFASSELVHPRARSLCCEHEYRHPSIFRRALAGLPTSDLFQSWRPSQGSRARPSDAPLARDNSPDLALMHACSPFPSELFPCGHPVVRLPTFGRRSAPLVETTYIRSLHTN